MYPAEVLLGHHKVSLASPARLAVNELTYLLMRDNVNFLSDFTVMDNTTFRNSLSGTVTTLVILWSVNYTEAVLPNKPDHPWLA